MDPINTPQQSTQYPSQQSTPQPMQTPISAPPEHKKVGPIVAILVVVLLLIIGALYIFASRMNQQPTDTTNEVANENITTQASVQPVTNTADDVDSIEADLNASVNGLDEQNF